MRISSVLLVTFMFNQYPSSRNVLASWKFWKVCLFFFFSQDFHSVRASPPASVSSPAPTKSIPSYLPESAVKDDNEEKQGQRRGSGVGGIISPFKKVQTSEIMGSIQLGIQQAVSGTDSRAESELYEEDFITSETNVFKHGGSNPVHQYSEFTFITHTPIAFSFFRNIYGIQTHDFLVSFCSGPLRELGNPGASGSVFYITQDDEFIMKTVEYTEAEFLKELLRGFYEVYFRQELRTLLPKFFGLYFYQFGAQNMRLVAMNNLLPSSIKIHLKYDLKGSTHQREASEAEKAKRLPTFKDLDFKKKHENGLYLGAETYDHIVKMIRRDCRFLAMYKIMDYSLLLGIHNVDEALKEKEPHNFSNSKGSSSSRPVDEANVRAAAANEASTSASDLPETSSRPVYRRSRSMPSGRLDLEANDDQADTDSATEELDLPPGGFPAFNEKGERLLLFLGIIDILQYYRFKKKVEHAFKSIIYKGNTISVHEPKFYARRFQGFLENRVFKRMPKTLRNAYSAQHFPSP